MSDKMPESMDEEAVARWVWDLAGRGEGHLARAVLALVEAKCFDAAMGGLRERFSWVPDIAAGNPTPEARYCAEAIVARVLGRDGGAR